MRRTLALFGAGVALGAVAMYFARDGGERVTAASTSLERPDAPQSPQAGVPAPRSIDFLTLATGSVTVTERAALFRLAAEADRDTLESSIAQVAGLPDFAGRRVALEALFTRYAEIDGPAAAAFARELDLPATALTPLFATWARNDARAALQALGKLEASAALTLGVAVLEALGNDDLGLARVLGAAPQVDADRFRIEAAIARAAQDPAAALDKLLELPPTKASTAFERLATVWIQRDVHGALAAAEALADQSQRNELKAAVLRAWARVDPDALVDYVADLDPQSRNEALRAGALQAFSLVDPQRALQVAEGVPGELGTMMKRAALMSLARDDPLTALSIAEGLPPGNERQQMLSVVATAYGRTNPDAALAWAQSLSPPAPLIVANVLAGLARVDPDRAIDLLFETMDATNPRDAGSFVALMSNGSLDGVSTAKLADRLLATPNRGPSLQMLTQMWVQRQPHDAARWLLAKGSAAPRNALGQAAMQLARTDPATAIAYVDTVAPEHRATWISSVADGYAQTNPRAAASWIGQFRGEPGYDAALAAIAGKTAQSDPSAAAQLFDSINIAEAPGASQEAGRIAQSWAERDPRAAAAWAGAIADDAARRNALTSVAAQWSTRDASGSRAWVLGLPAGATRDAALLPVLRTSATTTSSIDAVLLDAFSDAEAKQRAVGAAVRVIASSNVAAARQVADQYFTDPAERRAADQFIEQGRNGDAFGPSPPRLPPTR